MRFSVLLAGLCALPFASWAQVPAPDPAPTTPVQTVELPPFEPTREDAVLEAYIDGAVAAHMREHDLPGVALSVVRNGRILFAKGYGVAAADGTKPVSGQETLFRIGSVSKTFIWTSVMMLAERGEIDLDADVNRYLKDMQIPKAFGKPVTMNDLMAHRAGFEDTLELFTVDDKSGLTLTEALKAHMPKRVFPPGTRTSYSNWGAALAAKIVEDVSGVPYEEFLQREILTPLAMTHTTLKGPSVMPENLQAELSEGLKAENGWPAKQDYMQIGPYAPAGAMASTADDMAHWMLFHLGGGEEDGARLMSPATHALMWARAFPDRPEGADLAHGFMTKRYRDYESFGHGGATSAFFTNMVMVPQLGIGVFISQNATADRTLVIELPDLIIDRLAAAGHGPGATQTGEALAADYAGTYFLNRRSFTQFEKIMAANSVMTVAPDETGAVLATANGETTKYLPLAGAEDTFQDRYGNRIVFGRNAKGDVTHLTDASGVHSFDRASLLDNPNNLNLVLLAAAFFSLTTWLGAWRRQGRAVSQRPAGVLITIVDLLSSAAVFAFFGGIAWLTAAMSSATASDLLNYPPPPVIVFRIVALVLFGLSILTVIGLWPAWRSSGWSVWRKLHHTALALSLAAFAVMLVNWKVIFSAVA